MNFLKLIRLPNLCLIALMQLIVYFGFLKFQNVPLALSDFQFILLVISTVFIAAAGYIINDIFDQDTDTINKPKKIIVGKFISETQAYNYYIFINIIGVGIGFYLSNVIQKPGFATIFIFIAALLYFYATTLQSILLLGNFAIALITALSVLIIPIFTIFPVINNENLQNIQIIFLILKDFAIFAFFLNLIREIIKDCEDWKGDFETGIFTFPVKFGIFKTKILIFILLVFFQILILIYINNYLILNNLYYAAIFILVFIEGPLLYISFEIFKAKESKDFNQLSFVMKIVLFFSILSLVLINYNITQNVIS
ncbi:MAG: geranylgeranylglycerol-phosphate geranylgeranyltransferase [Flavobacterium sp.]